MITFPRTSKWNGGFVGRRLAELGQHLAELSRRVRQAVAEAIRETVAHLGRDAVDRVLGRPLLPTLPPEHDDDPVDHREYDPWDDGEEHLAWQVRHETDAPEVDSETSSSAPIGSAARSAVAIGLAAAGWWLRRQGTFWGAFAIGLAAGGIAAITRRLAGDGFLLVRAAHELLSYREAVSGFATP